MKLKDIAYARSGDKGSDANIGVIANNSEGYAILEKWLTAERVSKYFSSLDPQNTVRYELPNLHALNFVLIDALKGGGSASLRSDSQGKALGQALLNIEIPDKEMP